MCKVSNDIMWMSAALSWSFVTILIETAWIAINQAYVYTDTKYFCYVSVLFVMNIFTHVRHFLI